jgi:hypothetical protein
MITCPYLADSCEVRDGQLACHQSLEFRYRRYNDGIVGLTFDAILRDNIAKRRTTSHFP